jgi:hypothetical protein
MARSKNKPLQEIKVTFTLEERPLTFAQKEAGKRLFSSLISRAQTQLQEDIAIAEKAERKAQAGRRKPTPASEQDEGIN